MWARNLRILKLPCYRNFFHASEKKDGPVSYNLEGHELFFGMCICCSTTVSRIPRLLAFPIVIIGWIFWGGEPYSFSCGNALLHSAERDGSRREFGMLRVIRFRNISIAQCYASTGILRQRRRRLPMRNWIQSIRGSLKWHYDRDE